MSVVPQLFNLMAPTTMADLCSGPPHADMINDSINDQNSFRMRYIIFIDGFLTEPVFFVASWQGLGERLRDV